jgi:hypothetical protein
MKRRILQVQRGSKNDVAFDFGDALCKFGLKFCVTNSLCCNLKNKNKNKMNCYVCGCYDGLLCFWYIVVVRFYYVLWFIVVLCGLLLLCCVVYYCCVLWFIIVVLCGLLLCCVVLCYCIVIVFRIVLYRKLA